MPLSCVTSATQVQLQLLQPPTLADNSFQVAAAFSSPVASFNVSNMDLVHAAVAAIRRTNDSSVTLVFTGTPGKLANIQLKVRQKKQPQRSVADSRFFKCMVFV
jgi:hypothetical protein